MTPDEPFRQLLRDAADRIARDGWCQHAYAMAERRCLGGAIYTAAGFDVESDLVVPADVSHALAQVRAVLRARGVPANNADRVLLSNWNDAPERTAGEVIALLREAAEAP